MKKIIPKVDWKKISLVCILLTTVVQIVRCSNRVVSREMAAPKHIFSPPYGEAVFSDFTEDEEKRLLEAFNVCIPENEENACVLNFCKYERNGSSEQSEGYLVFMIEIDGVEDYKAFFEENSSRVWEKGFYSGSLNENFGYYSPKYFITYYEKFSLNPQELSEEEKESIAELTGVYEGIKRGRI